MTPCKVLGLLLSSVGTGCSRTEAIFPSGSPIKNTFADHFIGALREKVCNNAWNKDQLRYIHVNERCLSCDSMPRQSREKWQRYIAERPLSERERACIGKYKRSLNERRGTVTRGA